MWYVHLKLTAQWNLSAISFSNKPTKYWLTGLTHGLEIVLLQLLCNNKQSLQQVVFLGKSTGWSWSERVSTSGKRHWVTFASTTKNTTGKGNCN